MKMTRVYEASGKRLFDILASCLGLIILAPVLAVIAVALWGSSSRPILYRGLRVGRGSKSFYMYKFRTMIRGAEITGIYATADDDSRITPLGKYLRKSKLDELPQLVNVLIGDMGLVGPRPEVWECAALSKGYLEVVDRIRPGLTDWATLWNTDEGAVLYGSDDPNEEYQVRILPVKTAFQLKYLDELSFKTDISILVCTLARIIWRSLRVKRVEALLKEFASNMEQPLTSRARTERDAPRSALPNGGSNAAE